ncbi:hypothetical protein [Kitasatospora terrestris]|uniref:Secreted protein n=1 Tax=Kitasatospora terrestris TaxID=258051 RepID=A0ABP9DX78_9ACTN
MKRTTALAALTMAGLAMSAAPAAALPGGAPTGLSGLGHGLSSAHGVDTPAGTMDGAGFFGSTVSTTDLCHKDLEQYPVVGPLADRTTGACDAIGETVDHPPTF